MFGDTSDSDGTRQTVNLPTLDPAGVATNNVSQLADLEGMFTAQDSLVLIHHSPVSLTNTVVVSDMVPWDSTKTWRSIKVLMKL